MGQYYYDSSTDTCYNYSNDAANTHTSPVSWGYEPYMARDSFGDFVDVDKMWTHQSEYEKNKKRPDNEFTKMLKKVEEDKTKGKRIVTLKTPEEIRKAKEVIYDARKKFIKECFKDYSARYEDIIFNKKTKTDYEGYGGTLYKRSLSDMYLDFIKSYYNTNKKELKILKGLSFKTKDSTFYKSYQLYFNKELVYEADFNTWQKIRRALATIKASLGRYLMSHEMEGFKNISGNIGKEKYEIRDYQICEQCGADNSWEAIHCSECGSKLRE